MKTFTVFLVALLALLVSPVTLAVPELVWDSSKSEFVPIFNDLPTGNGVEVVGQLMAHIATLTPKPRYLTRHPANLSFRATVGEGEKVPTGGFIVETPIPHRFLIRAIGPTLVTYGVSNPNSHPKIVLYRRNDDGANEVIANQDGWSSNLSSVFQSVGAFPLQAGSSESAMVVSLSSGQYSAQITSDQLGGIALFELYDLDWASMGGLINISARAYVGEGEANLTVGVVIKGAGPLNVMFRGIGPALKDFQIQNALEDPLLTIFYKFDTDLTGRTYLKGPWTTSDTLPFLFQWCGAFPVAYGSKNPVNGWDEVSDHGVGVQCSAQVTSTTGKGGIALAEMYAGIATDGPVYDNSIASVEDSGPKTP